MQIPPLPLDEKVIVARERLRLLALGFKISGIIGMVMASFMIFHFLIFSVISFLPASAFDPPASHSAKAHPGDSAAGEPPAKTARPEEFPMVFFRIFAGIIGIAMCCGWTLGGLTYYAGHCLALRKHRTFIQVMAAINCIWIPYGTLLGIATFVVLNTPQAEAEFPALSPPPL